MYDYISIINTAGSALVALALGWAVLNPHVHHGVASTFGLSLMALGFLAIALALPHATQAQTIARACALIYTGAAFAVFGVALRTRDSTSKLRRVTDWWQFPGHAASRRRM